MIDETELTRCPDVDLIVVDRYQTRIAFQVDDWNATTLLACISEDPRDWFELEGIWPRYQIGPSAEDLASLNFIDLNFTVALGKLSEKRAWMTIDLTKKRICIGKSNDPIERDGNYAFGDDSGFGPEFQIPMHLPPWWELHCHVELSMVLQTRDSELKVRKPNREILWGPELSKDLARRMFSCFVEDETLRELLAQLASDFSTLEPSGASDDETVRRLNEMRNQVVSRTIAVHRDWLMTPRSDLGGRMPRECLHGGVDWIDHVIDGHKSRVSGGDELAPLPLSIANDPEVPMGRSEVCLYFDLCRELIESGWLYLSLHSGHARSSNMRDADEFVKYLADVKKSWLCMPYEGGDSPASIIESERHRMPRVIEVGHGVIDCDCPICEMMSAGDFGPTFTGIDGHHLELDEEFAFSLHETREEWEQKQCEFAQMSMEIEQNQIAERRSGGEEDDEFHSVWKNSYVSQDAIPGDSGGHIGISFLLADMIGSLKNLGAQQDIDDLNSAFRTYRNAGQFELVIATKDFQQVLENVAQHHSELVSRSADLQHRLDELERKA